MKALKSLQIPFNLFVLGVYLGETLNNAIHNGYNASLVWKYGAVVLILNVVFAIAYIIVEKVK